jgi:hypothetical protein
MESLDFGKRWQEHVLAARLNCLRHLDNFKKQYKHKDLTSLFWEAARATTEEEFHNACNAMLAINSTCVDWLFKAAHSAQACFNETVESHCEPTSSLAIVDVVSNVTLHCASRG